MSCVFMSFRTYVRNLYRCATRFLPLVEMTATYKTLKVPWLSFSGNQELLCKSIIDVLWQSQVDERFMKLRFIVIIFDFA